MLRLSIGRPPLICLSLEALPVTLRNMGPNMSVAATDSSRDSVIPIRYIECRPATTLVLLSGSPIVVRCIDRRHRSPTTRIVGRGLGRRNSLPHGD